jgi:hypothetical protein
MDKPGKYAAALAALNNPHNPEPKPPTVSLPEKQPIAYGKRSRAGWSQRSVLLKDESVNLAKERLRARGDRTDFSDLVQALLEAWLATSE